ncbi:MAG: hypothetical protein ACHQUC_05485 [Chlamydiales bacterium]
MKIKSPLLIFSILTQMLIPSANLHSECCSKKPCTFDFTFNENKQGWVGDFADYPVGEEIFFELEFGRAALPKEIPLANMILRKALFLSGNNHSDNLFMFVKRQIAGLKPNTLYALTFNITLEDDISPCQFGVGGSPGESVFVKVGASRREPQKIDVNGIYRINIDVGSQSAGGKNAIVVGDLANPFVESNNPEFQPIGYLNTSPLKIRSDHHGRLWLIVGTDSGFEGPTLYYIARIFVTAEPVTKSK